MLKSLIIVCSTFAVTSVFAQQATVFTWSGAANGTNMTTIGNWLTNDWVTSVRSPASSLPSGHGTDGISPGDYMNFDGVTTSNVVVSYGTGSLPNTGFNSLGLQVSTTPNQVSNVQIRSYVTTSAAIGVNTISNNSPNASFSLGDATANQLVVAARPAGTLHYYINNSTAPAIIGSSIGLVAGGGNAYAIEFGGTGDWIVNHVLRNNNSGSGPVTVIWDGPGTMTWTNGGFFLPDRALGPVGINGGTVVLKGVGLLPSFVIFTAGTGPGNNSVTNFGTLRFDFGSQSDIISRDIFDVGVLQMDSGTNTLSSPNSTFSGNIILNGGQLNAGAAENVSVSGPLGTSGLIIFNGGTLGYSANNAFDYSSRFSTAAGQQYRIDTAGQSPTFATGLSSSGGTLTKIGAGTLTLAGANSYSGATTVRDGKLVLQGAKSGTGDININDGAGLGLIEKSTQVTPSTLTLGAVTLDFDNVTNTAAAPLAASTISSSGSTVNINVNSGTFNTIGQIFPLFGWTSGSAPATSLSSLSGAGGFISTNGNLIQLTITDPPYIWTGLTNGTWDHSTTNWVQSGIPQAFSDGVIVLFDDSALGATNVAVSGVVLPSSTTVNNNSLSYSIASSAGNNIGGSGGLAKSGSGLLTLSGGFNAFTGVTKVNGGTLSVGALAGGGIASDIGAANSDPTNLVFNGGTLQYTGPGATIDRGITIGTGGGGIDASGGLALVLNRSGSVGLSGSGPRAFTLTGTNLDNNTLAANIINSPGGATALTKSGTGTWILTGTNTYSGVTTIAGGLLEIGADGPSGNLGSGTVINNGIIDFRRTGTNLVAGGVSGTGSVTNSGTGLTILAGDNTYQGGTTINAGVLQVGNGGGSGSLNANSPVVDNTTIIFNSTGNSILSGVISGTGQLIKRGSGLLKLTGTETFTGGITVDAGSQLQIAQGNTGGIMGGYNITNNGNIWFVRQDNDIMYITNNIIGTGRVTIDVNNPNSGDTTFIGTNTYSGNTWIGGGQMVVGDNGVTPFGGSIVGNVFFTNSVQNDTLRAIVFNRADDITFPGNIVGSVTAPGFGNGGRVEHRGNGTLTLTGNNTYPSGTLISTTIGTLVVGAGGTTGSIGNGGVTDNTLLVFNRAGSLSVPGVVSGPGAVAQVGSGTVTLSGANTYTGSTTISNGTLVLSGAVGVGSLIGGDVSLEGGTLAPGGLGSVGTLTIGGNLLIDSGTVLATLNPLLVQSNSFVSLTNNVLLTAGTATANPGTSLKLILGGPIPKVGDKYTIFSQPVAGGAGMTMVTPGFSVANNLAADGSVTVTATNPAPIITFTVSGGSLNLSWPSVWTGGVHLQAQTNSLARGLSSNWVTIPGTDLSNVYTTPLNKSSVSVFYRLVAP